MAGMAERVRIRILFIGDIESVRKSTARKERLETDHHVYHGLASSMGRWLWCAISMVGYV